MSYSIPLERAFLAKEYSRHRPSELRIVGTLLDSAFQHAPTSLNLERLRFMIDRRASADNAGPQSGSAVVDLISDRATIELISWMPGRRDSFSKKKLS